MSDSFNWAIEQLNCYPEKDGHTDVVFTVHWRLNAVNGEYGASCYGSVGLTYEATQPFTPYDELTQAQVVGWVQSALGAEQVAQMEAALAADIAAQINPPVVSPPLPWAPAAPSS